VHRTILRLALPGGRPRPKPERTMGWVSLDQCDSQARGGQACRRPRRRVPPRSPPRQRGRHRRRV